MQVYSVHFKKKYAVASVLGAMCLIVLCLLINNRAIGKEAFSNGQKTVQLPVLMYHSVCINKKVSSEYVLTPQKFEQDIKYLNNNGYTAVSCKQVRAFLQGNGFLPEKPVLITFDDGFYNNLSVCLPILQQYGFCAVVHIVGEYSREATENGIVNPAFSYLTWQQLQTLCNSDLLEIGSHTWNMHNLKGRKGCKQNSNEGDSAYQNALTADVRALNYMLFLHCGTLPHTFAYPFGAITESSERLLFSLDFDILFTCEEKINTLSFGQGSKVLLGRINRYSSMTTGDFMTKYGL